MEKTLTVDDRDGTREITVEEALQQRTYRDALAGKGMAQREIVKWILKREAWLAKHVPKAPGLAINYSYDSDFFLESRRITPIARAGAKIGRTSSLSLGRFRLRCAADEAAIA